MIFQQFLFLPAWCSSWSLNHWRRRSWLGDAVMLAPGACGFAILVSICQWLRTADRSGCVPAPGGKIRCSYGLQNQWCWCSCPVNGTVSKMFRAIQTAAPILLMEKGSSKVFADRSIMLKINPPGSLPSTSTVWRHRADTCSVDPIENLRIAVRPEKGCSASATSSRSQTAGRALRGS
jgi:hypothetical protein